MTRGELDAAPALYDESLALKGGWATSRQGGLAASESGHLRDAGELDAAWPCMMRACIYR
ncbi:MAG: hypothetical protein H6632_17540 [Anaerolineales bacterium]|nr:hypothetical protein [Anaerolineales bacterium]